MKKRKLHEKTRVSLFLEKEIIDIISSKAEKEHIPLATYLRLFLIKCLEGKNGK